MTFRQWLENILLRYRESLEKANKWVLLIMDGHGTHAMESSIDFCRSHFAHIAEQGHIVGLLRNEELIIMFMGIGGNEELM